MPTSFKLGEYYETDRPDMRSPDFELIALVLPTN